MKHILLAIIRNILASSIHSIPNGPKRSEVPHYSPTDTDTACPPATQLGPSWLSPDPQAYHTCVSPQQPET